MQGIAMKVMAEPGKYSVQQLQQAVESGSLPAYIGIPLIQEKLKQQKQMQGMEQARSPEGPSIAEQVMQEAQGVQALPTNLPQQYAGGGIVAFDEGGEVERYQNTGLVSPVAGVPSYLQWMYSGQSPVERERQARLEAEARARAESSPAFGAALPAASPPPIRVPDTGQGILGGVVDASGAARAAITGGPRQEAAAPTGPTAAGSPGITALAPGKRPVFEMPKGESYSDIVQRQIGDYSTYARNADVEAEAKKEAARSKITGQAFDEYKKSLEEEAKQAGAERAQAKNMALFKAGLAMMAGTSRHALENIGKGALLGAEDYQAAVKDLKKAEKERQKAFAHIEQARRAEAIGDRDTAIREIDAARDRSEARVRYTTEALTKGASLDKDQAFKLAQTQFAADTEIFKTNLAGGYTLEAAKQRAAGAGRGALTQGQLLTARMQAMKQVDETQIRNQVAQQLGFKKTPKPGADAAFDARVTAAYDQAINTIINRAMGLGGAPGGGGNPFQGFRIVPDE